MMLRVRVLLLVVCAALWVMPAQADDLADEADLHFQLGTEAYARGDFRGALEHFLRSNGLVRNRSVIFNIARSYEQLGQFPSAWRSYNQALAAAHDDAFRTRVQEALERIAPKVGVLEIETDPPGATIYLDRRDLGPRGETPVQLALAQGQYTVLIEKPGYEPATLGPLPLGVGDRRQLQVKLEQILGQVHVQGHAGATVRVDSEQGAPAGLIPVTLSLAPGTRRLFVDAPGMKRRELTITVSPKTAVTVRAQLEPTLGSLVVATDLRDALIEVDGRPVGFSPAVVPVAVGTHRVTVTLEGFRPITRQVSIREGAQTRLELALAREEQVTAASRTEQSVEEAPSSVTIVSGEELRAMGYQTIAEAVRGVRGLYVTDDRSYTTIGARGFSRPGDYGNKILILYDGQPVNDNILGQSFPGLEGRSDLDDVERIEVVRGPGSVLYGTGAFFGVINVVTHSRRESTSAEVGVAAHEYGVTRGRAFGYLEIPDGAVWTSVAAFDGDGRDFYFPEYREDASGLGGNARGIDSTHGGTVQGRVWWRDLTLQWFWHERTKQIPTGEFEALFGSSRNVFDDKRGFLELRFEPKLGASVDLMTRAHGNWYTFESTTPYAEDEGGLAVEEYQGRWLGLEQRAAFRPLDGLSLSVGGEVQRHFRASLFGSDESGEPYLERDDNPYWVFGIYGLVDADLSSTVRVSAGARYDAFSWEFEGGEESNSAINPRLALIVRPYSEAVTKVMAGKAFRAPSVYERLYASSVQERSLGLDPEQVYTLELEHSHRFAPSVVAVGSVFTNYVTDLVVSRGAGTEAEPFFYVNSPTPVLTVGAELELRREWREGWMVAANYGVQRSEYVEPAPADGLEPEADVPNSPAHLAALRGAAPIVGRSLSAMSRITYASERYDRNETLSDAPQSSTGEALLWDVVLSGRLMDNQVRYNLGVYNVAGWNYRAPVSGEFRMTGVPQNGRTVLASVTVRLP